MIYIFNAEGYFLKALDEDPSQTMYANYTTIAPPLEKYTARSYVKFKFNLFTHTWDVIEPSDATIRNNELERARQKNLLKYQKSLKRSK